jgi:hypothetical protein
MKSAIKAKLFQPIGYILSCEHFVSLAGVIDRVANHMVCPACQHRYFIIKVVYPAIPIDV